MLNALYVITFLFWPSFEHRVKYEQVISSFREIHPFNCLRQRHEDLVPIKKEGPFRSYHKKQASSIVYIAL